MNIITLAKRFLSPALAGFLVAATVSAAPAPHAPAPTASAAIAVDMLEVSPLPSFGFAKRYWINVTASNSRTGISVFVDSADYSNVVISFGKERAKEIEKPYSYSGFANLHDAARAFGDYHLSRAILLATGTRGIYKKVRNGKDVGLWIHVDAGPHMFNNATFVVRSVLQRPVGATTPPSYLLN